MLWWRSLAASAALSLCSAAAGAGGLDFDQVGARAVGRAGAVVVSDDGAAALAANPAGLARRRDLRLQLGVSLHDGDASFSTPGSPLIENRAGAITAPQLAVVGALGPVVLGAAFVRPGGVSRRPLPRPGPGAGPPFAHRYGGIALDYSRRAWLAGGSARVLPWLGIGASVAVSQVRLRETRHIWAGATAPGDAPEGAPEAAIDPAFDLVLTTAGRDDFVLGATAGALIAPLDLPMELALSAGFGAGADLSGAAHLDRASGEVFPQPELRDPRSRAELASPLVVRAGLRYLGERFSLEAGGDFTLYFDDPPSWRLTGVAVLDVTQATAALEDVPALIDHRDHGALRLAGDVELASGFLWLSAGYAYRMAAARPGRYAPGYSDLAGHTLAVGAESHWNGVTVTVGYSRSVSPAVTVTTSEVELVNPFGVVQRPVGDGVYDSARDVFGASLEVAWR